MTLTCRLPRGHCLLAVVLLLIAAASAQSPASPAAPNNAPLIQNVFHRHTLSLDGDWHIIIDPHEIGVGRRYYQDAKPTPAKLQEYDFSTAPTLRVPGDWNTQRPELFYYEGTVWYEKSFTYHPSPGVSTFLYVGAANYRAHVWVNGESLCEHEGGFTPFNCDATSVLKDGDNFVVISVNDARHADDIPGLAPDWWNYGGLTRDVMLVELPDLHIKDYSVALERGSTNRITGWVRLGVKTHDGGMRLTTVHKVTVRIPELNLSQEALTDEEGAAHFTFDAPRLQLWSPENPKLYAVEIASQGDYVTDEIGFRSIEVRGVDILLNGKPVFLRGITMHEEALEHPGRAHGDDDAGALLGLAKELGSNFVRLAHYPYDEHMTRMADRMGLLVWSEIPVWQTIDWTNPAVLQKAKQQLTEMITRDRNRASIILWSVTNESKSIPERTSFVRELVTTARALDGTRLITAATNQFQRPDPHSIVVDDPLIADLDVFGVNEYVGWYYGTPPDLDNFSFTTPYNKPMIVSEFGGEAKAGTHGVPAERWTEEYQEEIYKHQLAALSKVPFLRGIAPWVLKDFRSPHRQLPGIQDGYNRKGLVSDTGVRKKAFFVLQQFYRESPGAARSQHK
jgi:beta-glucuronidase